MEVLLGMSCDYENWLMNELSVELARRHDLKNQQRRRRRIYIAIIGIALLMSLVFAGGIIYEKGSRSLERVRIAHLFKEMSWVVLAAATDKEQGEEVVRVMRLTDPPFMAITDFGPSCDELFVLAPTTRGSVYLLKKDSPRRIIAWSKNLYEGDRLILWSDYSINWKHDSHIDLIMRIEREHAE